MEYKPEQFYPKERMLPPESQESDSHIARHNDIQIDIYKLIKLLENHPIETVSISELEHQLDHECWTDMDDQPIKPQLVIDKYQEAGSFHELANTYPNLAKHAHQIAQADYKHPIILFEDQVTDGIHRLCKAIIDEEKEIQAKRLAKIPEGALVD